MFSPGFVCGFVFEFVCEQDNSKTYRRILMNFQDMFENLNARAVSILGVIWTIIWIFWIHEM